MATKTIYMNDEDASDSGYIYPDSDADDQPGCVGSNCSEPDGDGHTYGEDEEYPEFYQNLEVISEDKKNKPRSMSIDSDSSDSPKRHNFKCGSCKKSFLLDKNQKMIRCTFCGYRILFKLRTRNYISYKTE